MVTQTLSGRFERGQGTSAEVALEEKIQMQMPWNNNYLEKITGTVPFEELEPQQW